MARNIELIGRFMGESRAFDYGPDRRLVIGSLACSDATHTVRGYANEGALTPGMTYRMSGSFSEHEKYGRQFGFSSFAEQPPEGPEAIVGYLKRAGGGSGGGITERIARLIWQKCGSNSVEMLIKSPELVAEGIPQWGVEKAKVAAMVLSKFEEERHVRIELIDLFDGHNFPRKTIDRAIKFWGTAAAQVLKDDPYKAMSLAGIGFKSADKFFCSQMQKKHGLGEAYQIAISGLKRQAMCAAYEVRSMISRTGATWVKLEEVEGAIRRNFGVGRCEPRKAIEFAEKVSVLKLHEDRSGKVWVANWIDARHEDDIAEVAVSFLSGFDPEIAWPDINDLPDTLLPSQREAMESVLESQIAILKGGPGTGKTYCLAGLVKAIIAQYGTGCVAIAAPTAKAAARVSETLRGYEIDGIWVGTIHSLLVVQSTDGGWSFLHGPTNPLPYRFIIIDESSMPDLFLMASFLKAVSVEAHVLFVGDEEQLPPVGNGKPFFDLQSVIPCGSLTEIKRNSGDIVRTCQMIRETGRIQFSAALDEESGRNLPLYEVIEGDIADFVENLFVTLREQVDPVWDCQAITPCNSGSLHARRELNARLQQLLNPDGYRIEKNPFRIGDKVICLRNGDYQTTEVSQSPSGKTQPLQTRVANGEIGRVESIEDSRLKINLFYPSRTVVVPLSKATSKDEERVSDKDEEENDTKGLVGDWDLAYAISIHKSQGSQWPYVVFIVDPTPKASRLMNRQLVYTAISRAEKATLCVGQASVASRAVRFDGLHSRKTFLREKIQTLLNSEPATSLTTDELMLDPLEGIEI